MPIIDVVLVIVLAYGVIKGIFKGFFVEVASLVAIVLGVYGAIHFSNYAGDYLSETFDWSEQTINITAFTLTFVAIVVLVSLAGKGLTKLADLVMLGLLNKLLGAVFGGIKMALIASTVLIIFDRVNPTLQIISDEELQATMLYKPIKALAPIILPQLLNQADAIQVPELLGPSE